MKTESGFTLIEIIIVIVILGALSAVAAPKFISLSEEADNAVFTSTASAYRDGIAQAHIVWLLRGKGQAVVDLLPTSDTVSGGGLSFNTEGYPFNTTLILAL